MRQILLQNAAANLLQIATEVYYKIVGFFIKKYDNSITNGDSYTNCDDFMIKCDTCYRLCFLILA